jgi:hypothetical protein
MTPLAGEHVSMLLVDVAGFGNRTRTNADQLRVRQGMYTALEAAFAACEVPWASCEVGDRGDGAMVLVPSDVSKNRLARRLPELVAAALTEHNKAVHGPARIRLRMVLHAGEVHRDGHGPTSDSLILAFRLLDAPAAKRALEASTGVLVVIVSEWFFDAVVRHDPTAVPDAYRPVPVTTKETVTHAWLRLLGNPSPPTPTPQPGHPVESGGSDIIL